MPAPVDARLDDFARAGLAQVPSSGLEYRYSPEHGYNLLPDGSPAATATDLHVKTDMVHEGED